MPFTNLTTWFACVLRVCLTASLTAAESGTRIAIAEVAPPPMPTALRGRFYPGEDRTPLTPIEVAAARLMAQLEQGTVACGDQLTL